MAVIVGLIVFPCISSYAIFIAPFFISSVLIVREAVFASLKIVSVSVFAAAVILATWLFWASLAILAGSKNSFDNPGFNVVPGFETNLTAVTLLQSVTWSAVKVVAVATSFAFPVIGDVE